MLDGLLRYQNVEDGEIVCWVEICGMKKESVQVHVIE